MRFQSDRVVLQFVMTEAETADFHGLDVVSHNSLWGRVRLMAQRVANDKRKPLLIISNTGTILCIVNPVEDPESTPPETPR